MEILFWIAVLTWMAKRSAEDVLHAVKGTPNPRYELKKQRAAVTGRAPKQQPRYGGREWFADLLSDAMVANTEKRRAKAKAKGQPVDDMVDLVREDQRYDEELLPDPREAELLTQDSTPCGRCRHGLVGEASNGELLCTVCGFLSDPLPVFRHETPEPPVPPTREEKPVPSRPNHDDEDDLTADDVLNALAGPGGLFAGGVNPPKCSWHQKPMQQVDGQLVCPACIHIVPQQPAATDDRPDARIYQFPNVKTIEKEITMANSEVTGLSTAIAFAEQTAAVHASFSTAGTEGYVSALAQHGVGDGTIGSAREAMEKSAIAAAAWEKHRDDLAAQHNVKEAYQGTPDAGNKEFLLNG